MLISIKTAKIFLVAGYVIGVIGLLFKQNEPVYFQLTWVFTLLTLVILLAFHKPFTAKFLVAIILVGIAGFTIEAIGTNTGLIFGEYSYGKSLGIKVFETPLTMIVNWMLTVYLAVMFVGKRVKPLWLFAILASLLMVGYDIILEPVAIRLDMWSWSQGVPPLQNYIGWFLVSLPLVAFLRRITNNTSNPLAGIILFLQIAFFSILNILMVVGFM
jgi:bisanhydrobacterioruberin hydratase